MSSFSGLNTAYSALAAARAGIDVVGQNIANANTVGYTRQRLETSSIAPTNGAGLFSAGIRAGVGVSVDGISRLGNVYLDTRVRNLTATAGFSSVRANVLSSLEATLNEPGENGISTQLQEFWAAWQGLSNNAGDTTSASILLERAGVLTTQIATQYRSADAQWTELRTHLTDMVAELNDAATQVADLNARIRETKATAGSINELVDRRNVLTTTIASLAGGTVRDVGDGTVEVLIAGNAIVSSDLVRPITITGSTQLAGAAGAPVTVEWAHRPGASVNLISGEIAGALSMLGPADATGTGGTIAEAAESYNDFAKYLADQVNAIHQTGATTTGATGLDFFGFASGVPFALGMSIIPTDASGIAAGSTSAGAYDGSVADQIAHLGVGVNSPDNRWAGFVSKLGVTTRTERQQASLADLAATAAVNTQLANASVSLDEETVNLMTYQVAYQGAARVMTAIDELLDTLINRTGTVGR